MNILDYFGLTKAGRERYVRPSDRRNGRPERPAQPSGGLGVLEVAIAIVVGGWILYALIKGFGS